MREWYREVIKHSAFSFVSNGDQFLTVHMKNLLVQEERIKNDPSTT